MSYYTAQDLVHHLLSSTGGGAQDGEHSAVRMAVVHGVREVMQARQWLWHTKRGLFTTTTDQNYLLPPDVKDIDQLVTESLGTLHCYISPQEYNQLETLTVGRGDPYYYTIMRSATTPTQYEIRFVGEVTSGIEFNYTYRVLPAAIKYMGYERSCRQGTVQAAGTALLGTDTTFPTDAVGRVVRFGTLTDPAEPIGSLTPFVAERKIFEVTGPTSAAISPLLTVAAGTKYTISDELDASPQMYTACLSACEMWYARMAGKPATEAVAMFNRDMRIAMENDVISPIAGRSAKVYATPRSLGWHSDLTPDVS